MTTVDRLVLLCGRDSVPSPLTCSRCSACAGTCVRG